MPPYHAGVTSNEVNHNGNFPIEGQKKSGYAQRTLPVRWDDQRRTSPLSEPHPVRLPSAYKANGFGLWHVNGNVYEWCESGWAYTLKGAIDGGNKDVSEVAKEDVNSGTRRVVRGGFWSSDARFTRSSNRYRFGAGYRFNDLGFRLSRTRSN